MAGRRNQGGAAALVGNLYAADREHRIKQEDERRAFDQRLQEAGITAGIRSGQISPSFNAQGGFSGFQRNQAQPDAFQSMLNGGSPSPAQADLVSSHDWKLQVDSKGKKVLTFEPKKQQKEARALSPQNQLFQDTRNASDNLLRNQQLPSDTFIPEARQSLIGQLPQGPFTNGPDGSFISGSNADMAPGQEVPRSQVVSAMAPGLAQQMAPSLRQPMIDQSQSNLDSLLKTRQMLQPQKSTTDTQDFRDSIRNALDSIANGKAEDPIRAALVHEYPDKVPQIDKILERNAKENKPKKKSWF